MMACREISVCSGRLSAVVRNATGTRKISSSFVRLTARVQPGPGSRAAKFTTASAHHFSRSSGRGKSSRKADWKATCQL